MLTTVLLTHKAVQFQRSPMLVTQNLKRRQLLCGLSAIRRNVRRHSPLVTQSQGTFPSHENVETTSMEYQYLDNATRFVSHALYSLFISMCTI